MRRRIAAIAVQRSFLGAEPALRPLELHNGLAQGHVFHDFDHGRHTVHVAGPVWIDAHVRSRQDLQQFCIRDIPGKRHRVFQLLFLDHLSKARQFRPSSDTGEINIAASRVFDSQGHSEKNVQPILTVHHPDIPDEVTLAMLPGRIRWNRFERFRTRAVAHNKDVLCAYASARHGDLSVAVVGGDHNITAAKRALLQPQLHFVKEVLLPVLGQIQLRVHIVVIEDVLHTEQFEGERYQENIVRRIASLNHMKASAKVNPPRVEKLPKQRERIFTDVSPSAVSLFSDRMPIYVYSLKKFIAFFSTLTSGAQYNDLISSVAQRAGFFPYPEVHRNREVLHNDQNFLAHRNISPKATHTARLTRRASLLVPSEGWGSCSLAMANTVGNRSILSCPACAQSSIEQLSSRETTRLDRGR